MPEGIELTRGEQLRAYRTRLGLQQEHAYKFLGITLGSLVDIEKGRMPIDDTKFQQLAGAYRQYEIEHPKVEQSS